MSAWPWQPSHSMHMGREQLWLMAETQLEPFEDAAWSSSTHQMGVLGSARRHRHRRILENLQTQLRRCCCYCCAGGSHSCPATTGQEPQTLGKRAVLTVLILCPQLVYRRSPSRVLLFLCFGAALQL